MNSGQTERELTLCQVAAETPRLVVSGSVIWLSVSCSLRPGSSRLRVGVGHLVVSGSVIWLSAGRVGRKVPGPWMGLAARRSCNAWPPWRTRAGWTRARSGRQPAALPAKPPGNVADQGHLHPG